MKKAFRVEMTGEVREVYRVMAETAEEAEDLWMDGKLVLSESMGMELAEVTEEED